MDYASFLKVADGGRPPSVALLHGREPFLLDDAIARATRGLFAETVDLTLAREVLDAREGGVDGIVQAALMLPWTTERRLVVARNADTVKAKQAEALVAYLEAPNPSTVLLLVIDELLQGAHWLLRAVPAAAQVPVLPLSGPKLVSWLRDRATLDGYEVAEPAARLLVELSGDDLTALRGELEKAALAGGPDNRRVGLAEVRAVVGEHRLHHVFDLMRALARQDSGRALALMESLLNAGEEPFALLGMIAREQRALWQAADGLERGRDAREIARGLRRPPHAAEALVERARLLAPGAAARQLEACWDTERRLKLGAPIRPELALLVTELCAG